MHFLFYGLYKRYREGLVRDQGRDEPCDLPFWQLLMLEFPILVRRVGPLKVVAIIGAFFAFVLLAEIGLNEATPGPFLSPRLRLVTAAVATALFVGVWSLVHAVRSVAAGRSRGVSR